MIATLGFKISIIAIVSLISCVYSEQQYGSPGGTLYVAESDNSQKITVINRNTDEKDVSLGRKKRDATIPPPPLEKTVERSISTWTTHLNDSHQQLMVHWVGEGSNVIICLARDSSARNKGTISSSALYISYDYGKNFTNKTENFRLGDDANSGYAQLDKFFNHPKYPEFCVFVDSTNKKLYYTQDNGVTIHRSDLSFHPSELAFDEEVPNRYVILDKVDSTRNLFMTLDGGKTFKLIQSYVKTFLWSSAPGYSKMFYVERWKPGGNSTVLSVNDPANIMVNANELFADAKDFQIKGDFMFATKQSKEKNSLDLYISHQRGPFFKAEFQTELDLNKFHIADVTDKRIFVSVMHTENLANLYVSEISRNFTQYNFVLSLEQVLCYFPDGNWKDSWLEDVTEDPFTDLYRVEGLKGIYIASKVNHKSQVSNIEPEHLVSLITFDHGVTWSPINPPVEDENGKPINCHIENSCSLHLCQKFSQLYPVTRSASIMSSKSAPGIIMATGVLGKSLKGIPGVYISRDAGLTWRRILKDYYFFNYGDHGGVLVAVKYFKSRGETRRILYSTNEGIEWKSYQFNADDLRIYGLMTEPGENTTTFTMFGSANEQHQWIIITIDLLNAFPRNCTADDYKFWSPTPPNSPVSCVLGTRDTFQRRLAHTNCHNGIGYERPVKKELCECSRRDYECDFGFLLSNKVCIRNQSLRYDPYATPSDCRPGQFYQRTKGYRKIDGDVCTTSYYMPYEPDLVPCPLEEPTEFILVALRDRIARIDLSDNTTVIPVRGQQNIVAIEFDMKNNCIYWADIEVDKIIRQCFDNGNAQETVVDTELASIEGMALDWISNVLFFVDGLRKKIEAVRTDLSSRGRMRATILDSKVLSKPRGIAVHPRAGYLFWTDWDRNSPSVSRSNLDGKEVKKLFTNPIVKWPNGITIDQMADRIYWVDAMEDYIASADLNGQYFQRILWNDDKVTHPFAVAVLKNKMYWDDWKAKSIFTADKDTGANIVTINDSLSGLMDLKVFAYFMQHGSNACSYKNTSCDTLCLGGPGNTFSCLCPDGFKSVNGKCMCPSGLEPAPNMTCAKQDGSCSADEFTCKNGVCITNTWRCDGNDDCGDNSDEASCTCEPHMIACDDARCYLPHWRCDGDMDCLDMSDEKDCAKQNCSENQFTCANGNCIEKRWVCDGDNDCKDGSDERNCTQSLPKRPDTLSCVAGHVFLCGNDSNALCIPNSWVCDGEKDCPGAEDEREERCKNSTCAPYMYRCPSGKCIYMSWVCDGENDCGDAEGSDEKDCAPRTHTKLLPRPEKPDFPNNGTCSDWMFKCDNGNCLPYWWRCDGINDCGDNSDEVACGLVYQDKTAVSPEHEATRQKCSKNQFTCSSGACIPLSWVCDSTNDCEDGADERSCARPPPGVPRCDADSTPCADGLACIRDNQLCDGVLDCADHSDEQHCANVSLTYGADERSCARPPPGVPRCDADSTPCADGLACIRDNQLCDGVLDCADHSDEQHCANVSLTYGADERSCARPPPGVPRCDADSTPCADGLACIRDNQLCDGVLDCADHSDEQHCANVSLTYGADERSCARPPPGVPRCDADSTPCADGLACIRDNQLCDGVLDCADHSDEQHCANVSLTYGADERSCARPTPGVPRCDADSTPCADGLACIRDNQLCDGVLDCADHSDEQHFANVSLTYGADERSCARPPPGVPRCDADSTPCADGLACIRDNQLCDGVLDCADHSDEQHCANKHKTAVECPSRYFQCDDGTRCLWQVMVCNGHQDCYDGTDEANCSSDASHEHLYQFLSIGVDQSSINSTSFLISCWMAQQKMVLYTFLPSIAKVSDGVWKNMTWTTDSVYRFTDLEPFTNYNVTVFIQDSKSNKTYASMKYVNTTTGEGVPSPPRRLTVRQMVGSRVNLVWDPPIEPRGVVRHYTVHYVPPLPPMEKIVPAASNNASVSFIIFGYFKPNRNYSFWVTATNNAFTSSSSTVMNLTFDAGGDVDDIVNASMSRLSPTAVSLKWNRLRGVEGYLVETRLPRQYPQPPVINTTDNRVIVQNLPKNVQLYIDIKAYKNGIVGQPFTIPVVTEGTADELIHLHAEQVKENRSSVRLSWNAPNVDQNKDKELEYEVHYLLFKDLRRQTGHLSNATSLVTKNTSVVIEGLQLCETYVFSVGLVGGQLSVFKEFITKEDPKAPVRDLHFVFDQKKSQLQILWNANCDVITEPIAYRLDITELTHNRISRYELKATDKVSLSHVIENVPIGGRYNVCMHTSEPGSEEKCAFVRSGEVEPPHAVVAWLSPNGHLMVSWQHPEDNHTDPKHRYQIIVSDKEIPEDLLHPTDDMKTAEAEFSPLLMTASSVPSGPLFVSVRAISKDGYLSDLSEVRTLTMQGAEAFESERTASAVGAVWWGAGAACVAAVALGAALLHMALRHRRLARSLLRLAATPRYDSRRGQATIDHDDDDVPPITGFSDDEPLVIA